MKNIIKISVGFGLIYGAYTLGERRGVNNFSHQIYNKNEEQKICVVYTNDSPFLKINNELLEINEFNQVGSIKYRLEGLLKEDYSSLKENIRDLRKTF